jgi:D-ribose pyranose/furanose isomerase RbsD
MLKTGILHNELKHALASMGHGDILLVTDAGFPTPRGAWRIELAISHNFPDLVPILELINAEFISEKVMFAEDMVVNNGPMHRQIQRIFTASDLEPVPHQRLLTEIAHAAKAVVRTAGYVPWGNVALVSGVDPFKYFADPEVVVPEFYRRRMAQMRAAGLGPETMP